MKGEESKSSDQSPNKNTGTGAAFVKENFGNIKDFYKISSCIGRGKYIQQIQLFNRFNCI